MSLHKIHRIVDANFNRAKEALRVCEDILRFYCEDKKTSDAWKKARHQLTKILLAYPVTYHTLLKSRSSSDDVGKDGFIADKKKTGWKDLLISNAKRSQEALRTLEELSKIIAPQKAASFQKLRFKIYDLEKTSAQKL